MGDATSATGRIHLSDIDRALGRLNAVIHSISAQVGPTRGSSLIKANALLDQTRSTLSDFQATDFDPELWIDDSGLLRVGGAEPTSLLDGIDLAGIKRLGRPEASG